MNYFWLIRNCFLFFCFRLSLLLGINSTFLSLLSLFRCVCRIASLFSSLFLKSSHYIYLYFSGVLVFCLFCSHDAVCLFLCIFQYSLFEYSVLFLLVEVMLSGGIAIPSTQVRPTIHLLRRLLSFSIYSPSFFSSCFLFWHGYSSIRIMLQF